MLKSLCIKQLVLLFVCYNLYVRVIVQRVSNANCKVDGNITGEINNGYMLLVGFGLSDGNAVVEKLVL